MARSRVTLEWRFGESVEWTDDPTGIARASADTTSRPSRATGRTTSHTSTGSARHWRSAAIAIVTLLLVSSAAIYGLIRRAEANLTAIESEIRQALSDEALSAAPDLDSLPPLPTIVDFELQGDVAIVHLLVAESDAPWRPAPYRTTRFFRAARESNEPGWTPIDVEPPYWGDALTRETEHFRFEYRQRDAQAVEAFADEVDALYARLLDEAGLERAHANGKLIVEVVPRADDEMLNHLQLTSFWKDRLLVPSPPLMRPPASMSDVEALRSAVAAPLASSVLNESIARAEMSCVWNQAVEGLNLWWREANSALPSPTRYRRDHMMHNWVSSAVLPPVDSLIGKPRDCLERQIIAAQVRALRTLGAKSIFEYMAHRYSTIDSAGGGAHFWLAPLLEGLHTHDGWDTLIPAVLGVSVEEFDAGWRAYMADAYGDAPQED